MEATIFKNLTALAETDYYPFHMPGHKRSVQLAEELGLWKKGLSPFSIDITEIPDFDDLHEAEGIIKDAEERVASLYGAYKSFLQVNGSTGAILSAVGGATNRGDTVLMARNSHKSVYHAVELFGLVPVYLEGRVDGPGIYEEIKTTEVEQKLLSLKEKGIKPALIILTSPTYEGLCSDIEGISRLAERFGVLLMVDEAHGAHFGISKSGFFPETSVRLGADIVVQSLHKTLPSFTQTGVLHVARENERLVERIRRKINLLETSSPSYFMMAGIENCILAMISRGEELFLRYEERLRNFYEEAKTLRFVRVYEGRSLRDPGKIILSLGRGSGNYLYDCLYKDYKLVMEMKSKDYVIAMTSIFDTEDGFSRLLFALKNLDFEMGKLAKEGKFYYTFDEEESKDLGLPEQVMLPCEARETVENEGADFVSLDSAEGRISADHVYFYPPGIPLVVAGEKIDSIIIEKIKAGTASKIQIYGGSDGYGIFVCADGQKRDRKGQYL